MMPYLFQKEKVLELGRISFCGLIKEVNTVQDVKHVVQELEKHEYIGFDTESKPVFKKGEYNSIALIQLVTETHAFLVRHNQTGFILELERYLKDKRYKKIGIGLNDDVKKLREIGYSVTMSDFIDLGKLARAKGVVQNGARMLTARYLKKRLSKSEQVSNWERKNLTKEQKKYAATDGWVCLQIYPKLQKDNTDYHKMAEECQKALLPKQV